MLSQIIYLAQNSQSGEDKAGDVWQVTSDVFPVTRYSSLPLDLLVEDEIVVEFGAVEYLNRKYYTRAGSCLKRRVLGDDRL